MQATHITFANYQQNHPIYYHTYPHAHRDIILFVNAQGICGLHFQLHPLPHHLATMHARLGTRPLPDAQQVNLWWQRLHDLTAHIPIALHGTPFQKLVWKTLCTIPHGQTRSYTSIAQQIGKPNAIRAVASACAHNIVAYLIPCHRVIHKGGTLSNYRWHRDTKKALLQQESAWPTSPSTPPPPHLTDTLPQLPHVAGQPPTHPTTIL